MTEFLTTQPFLIIILVFCLALFILSKSADILTESAASVSKMVGISEVVVGATIVSLGTSLPEFATSLSALATGSNDLALGNALGSIITNMSFILGIGILYGAIPVSKKTAFNTWLVAGSLLMLFVTGLVTQQVIQVATLPRLLGLILLGALPVYLFFSFKNTQTAPTTSVKISNKGLVTKLSIKTILAAVVVALSASVLVATVQVTARRLGVSEAIISATIVALGTSLPELTTVIASAKRGYGGLAFGNLVGASLMNLFLVLGTTISFSNRPLVIPTSFLQVHFPLVLLIFLYLLFCIYNSKKHRLNKKEGLFFLVMYGGYLIYNLFI